MKCALAKALGEIDDVLDVSSVPARPKLKPGSGQLLVRVHACSLSPGDYRMLSGACELVKKPEAFPYIPGLDVCGTVVEVDDQGAGGEQEQEQGKKKKGKETPQPPKFKMGDCVVGTWTGVFGVGGLAEYALLEESVTVLKPAGVNYLEGAALANSASHALQAFRRARVQEGDRVLVLGGSGGMGTMIVQLARDAGASFVAATSTDEPLLMSLGADQVINYREIEWSEVAEFAEAPFDVIVDCAEGVAAWRKATRRGVLKNGWKGGRFIAVVLNEWHIEIHRWVEMPAFLLPPLGRQVWTGLCNRWLAPRYKMHIGEPTAADMEEVSRLVEAKRLKVALDPSSPFAFTTQGVRDAFHAMAERRGHGKVVVQVSDETDVS